MLVRIILAVLILTGNSPFRICTCGAAELLHGNPSQNDATDHHEHDDDCPASKPPQFAKGLPIASFSAPTALAYEFESLVIDLSFLSHKNGLADSRSISFPAVPIWVIHVSMQV